MLGKAKAKALFLSVLLVAATGPVSSLNAKTSPIHCRISVPSPHTHLFHVELQVDNLHGPYAEFKMPVWIPGSYLIREFERNVESFAAWDADGQALPWRKTRKNTWRVRLRGNKVRVTYRVYAFELSVRTSYLDADRAFLNPSSVVMFVAGQTDRPYILQIDPPPGWQSISTGLDSLRGDAWTRFAHSYDELVDCPVLIGNHRRFFFQVRGIPHELAVSGEGPVCADSVVTWLPKIVAEAASILGNFPYKRYVFLTILSDKGGGGLEHQNSCALLLDRFAVGPQHWRRRFLPLVSHEFFHVWNVKAIRPEPLTSYDYDRENYTTLLWLAEGFTTYYSGQIRLRLGLTTSESYLKGLARQIAEFENNPGRFVQSLELASYDAWIKYYRPDENSPNVTQSYYRGGALFASMLDLAIRHGSGGAHSLDDAMKVLYDRAANDHRGVTKRDLQAVCEELADQPLDTLFSFVSTTSDFSFEPYLLMAGLQLVRKENQDLGSLQPFLGARFGVQDGRTVVRTVRRGSPAERGGLYARDEILAVEKFRVGNVSVGDLLRNYQPGDTVTILLARQGVVREIRVVLGRSPRRTYELVRVEHPTRLQDMVYRGWLHIE